MSKAIRATRLNNVVSSFCLLVLSVSISAAQSSDATQPPAHSHHQHPSQEKKPAAPQSEKPAPPADPHAHHRTNAPTVKETAPLITTATEDHSQPSSHTTHSQMMTTMTGGPFRSMKAIGSGTALQPASTPMYGWHFTPGEWMVMVHAELKAGFNHQGGARGVGKAQSPNWLMAMAERNVGRGRMMLRGMMTAEPLTTPHGGFPQLFQTGETWRQRPLIDAQHPHDLFMELAASYTVPLSENISFQLYGGPVAEPALGPVAFMHRLSAMDNPSVPLAHHWQDSTHISHGVVTGALTIKRLRLEASAFNAREPDENRATIEFRKMNSYSWRVWLLPTPHLAMQFSYGYLRDPETLHAGDVVRRTASISWNRPLPDGNLAATAIWGRNAELHGVSNSYLVEASFNFRRKNYAYLRGELLDKQGMYNDNTFGRPGLVCLLIPPGGLGESGESPAQPNVIKPKGTVVCQAGNTIINNPLRIGNRDLHPDPGPVADPKRVFPPEIYNRWFRVAAFTLGGVRDLIATEKFKLGLGADLTLYHYPDALNPIYGHRTKSYQIFLRFRPGEMR